MPRGGKNPIDKDVLYKLYIEDGMSATKIGELIKRDRHCVMHYVREYRFDTHHNYGEENMKGRVFDNLTILSRNYEKKSSNSIFWNCQCICGRVVIKSNNYLRQWKHQSCGCRGKGYEIEDYGGIPKEYWNSIMANATHREMEFSISIQYAWGIYQSQGGKCKYSGIPIVFDLDFKHGARKGHPRQTASLDRKDSDIGYVEGNVQWVHKDINKMKNVFSEEYFLNLVSMIYNHQSANDAIKFCLDNCLSTHLEIPYFIEGYDAAT